MTMTNRQAALMAAASYCVDDTNTLEYLFETAGDCLAWLNWFDDHPEAEDREHPLAEIWAAQVARAKEVQAERAHVLAQANDPS